jgi:hypothetical protein
MSKQRKPAAEADLCARHLYIGWWSLLGFLVLGVVLESLHGFKAGFYLDVSNETRRLMWTLAHAHGALLSLVNIAFGMTTRLIPEWTDSRRTLASRLHIAALVLLPLGFFAGGLVVHGGDPGLGILLVPPGGLVLFAAVYLTARGATRR